VEEQVFRASGPGGQHVNKTSSAVRLIHQPTGIAVACQGERSQHKNRATAMKMLAARLARVEEEKREAAQAAKYNQMPKVGFGSQIRSYFLHPDQRVKDARTGYSETNFHNVLDGHIQEFLDSYLRFRAGKG
jgi:peptide chain release factor 2